MSGAFSILGGKVGSAINRFGTYLNNPLPDFGISERLEYQGSKPLTTQQRIDKSIANTGAVAEGDYSSAVNLGYSPVTPSRADGGILTQPQQQQNTQAAQSGQILGAESPGGVSAMNPAQKNDWAISQGYDGWDQYQDVISTQRSQQSQPDLYAEINSAFDDVLGGLGGQQSSLEGSIRENANTQKQGINEQLGYGVDNLNTQRGTVRENQASTLADLSQNLRDSARNIGMYLGAKGAGNGSATQAASFALTKMFGKERAGVQRQGSQQLADIDMAENNLRAKASEMLNNVDTWVNSQMSDIAGKFNDLRNNIGMMKGQMRAQAVESLWNEYNNVQRMREQYSMAIAESARNRLGQLNNLKLELSNASNFDPQAMVFNEYGFNPTQSYMPEDTTLMNPLALARRKDEELA